MKSRTIKTRIAAFGLALLMGLSPLGNLADVHAAETQNLSEPVTEHAEISETEQTEEVSEAAKHLVTAEDITKDISDKDFMAETCMEGIHYNPEKEDVTLERIEAEDGGSYHPDQEGTYIATYWVVPKDARDSYSVSRKIILTDTEGQAHTEENGGQKQKEDTNSEEDSETPVQEIPDVEVTVSGEDADAQAARELEEKIEDGEVMMLSGAENTFRARETVHLEKGETIYYPSYIGNYLTCWFTVNGKIAYCLESHRSSPPSGDYVAQVLDSNKNLQKVLYYGYGGAGDITGSYLSGKSAEEKYVYTHIAASYAYAGEAGFTGCKYEDLVNAGVIAYIDHLFAMEEPPKGEISLSKTSVKAVRNGNVQKTPDITLSGDHRNYISVQVPKDITIYNKTKGTSAENGALKIYGGDTFYLTAPMLHTGKYSSGELHGSVGETWRTLVLSTGNSNQDIGVFESEKANPVSFTVDWLEMTRIELLKQDADTKNPLDGAVYGIYTDSKCEHLLMEMPVTGEEGKAVSDYFEAAIKTVYVKEIKAPDKYAQSDVIHKVDVEAGKTVTISATDERVKGAVHIQKIDKETQAFLPQGDSSLAGAVYGLYAREDIVHPDGKTGVLFKKDSLIAQGVIKEDGTLDFSELYLGKMYVKEITPPEGYTVDPTEYEVDLAYEGQGYESSLYEGETIISPLEVTGKGSYKENPKEGIVITVSSDTAHQIDPDTGAVIVEVEQPNDEQVGSLTLTKTGEQPVEVKGDSLLAKAKRLAGKIKDAVTGEDTDTGVFHDFVYEESGVEGATFELYAKDMIYSPDGAKDEQGNPVIRYEKDDLVATLVTDKEGKAVVNNLPLGSYYLKETVAGDHFVLNPEQKEFTLTAEDDTQAVVYEGVAYKNERQKISISVEKKDAVTEEKLEGVIFGLYAKEDILSQQGEVLVEKDTLLEKKATDEKGQLTFDSDLYHGKYYVKEEVRKPGYLPNEEIWEIDASYTDQNLAEIKLTKEVENQPTESQFTKTDATTGEELEGAKLQIIDQDGNIVEEWISTKEPHVVYGLLEGTYTLHEELPPYAEGYVSAEDIEFEIMEDGSVTKVEMKDTYSKVEISKTDLTTGKELEGAKLQILNKDGEVLEEWVTDGKPHLVEKLPVGEELILREITAPEGYEIAEDVKFTLEDTMEVQKVEMKDARTPETPSVPQTGDDHWKPILLFALLGVSAAGLLATMFYKKRHKKADEAKKEE